MLLAAAVASSSVAAQTPPPGQVRVQVAVSPAGQAVLKKYLGTPDPVVVQQVQQLGTLRRQIAALADAPKLDMARLQSLMRQQEGVESAIRRRGNDRSLAMLNELSEADRLKFVRSLRAAQPATKPPGQ